MVALRQKRASFIICFVNQASVRHRSLQETQCQRVGGDRGGERGAISGLIVKAPEAYTLWHRPIFGRLRQYRRDVCDTQKV